MHPCICRVYFITMYLVAVYVPVSLTCYVCRRINLILLHVVSSLLRLLYGTHFLQTFVHVHFMAPLPVNWKPSILIMFFLVYAVGPLVTARASDSMFYPLTLCALQIVFFYGYEYMIMITRLASSCGLSVEFRSTPAVDTWSSSDSVTVIRTTVPSPAL